MLRATFMGFEASKTAIFANQKAIDIVGNNIANSETTGYTKQRVERASIYVTNYQSRTASSTVGLAGMGVDSLGVSQTRDSFLDKCFRDEYSESSFYGQQAAMIDDILNVFPEAVDVTDTSGILGAIENLYTNLNTYIQSPTLESEANLVKSAFTNICQVLQQANTRLNTVAERQKEDLSTSVERTNEILERIAYINKMVASDATIVGNSNSEYFTPNELSDERNLLLDELASYSDISVSESSAGVVSVKMGDKLAVDEFEAEKLCVNNKNNGCTTVTWLSSGDKVNFESGSIKAYVNVLNGRGANAGAGAIGSTTTDESSVQGVPYYRDRINLLAKKLVEITNTSIPETMTDANGQIVPKTDEAGNIVYKTLLTGRNAAGEADINSVSAATITISDEWTNGGASYFIYNGKENVEDYAQKLSARLCEKPSASDLLDDSPYKLDQVVELEKGEKFSGTFNEYIIEMVGKLGTDVSFNKGRQEAAALVADDFLDSRDSVAGVQQDEETTNLMIFQKAFSAASRVMTTMDDLLDIVINRMGRVGL